MVTLNGSDHKLSALFVSLALALIVYAPSSLHLCFAISSKGSPDA